MELFLIILLICAIVFAEPGIFYNPPTGGPIHEYRNNPVYILGETVQLRWDTTLETFSIMIWQNDNLDYEWVQTNLHDVTSYDWIVSTNRDLNNGEVFFFQVRNASDINDPDGIFASHYFNITEDDSASFTASSIAISTTQATASTPSLRPSLTTTQAVATTTTAGDNSQGNSGLSGGTKIGVGVGVGLGGAFVAALAIFLFVRRRSKSSTQVNESIPVTSQTQPVIYSKSYNGQAHNEAPKIFEAPANEARRFIELP
ncbi:uncharacterized protein PGRI_083770 [Penicillium griseofulvum]|uniref:Mid2 domain-containing protein n=1 Tax=Penicillium patulum TaxID=5078 RepID=A0A135LSZ6_PENPA|nr:uncharacterized protein PGRI_083770 [Penicillium griseofulvum]KXG52093.1 hypothetical protein PGRI_083770 [Penicillium griseofulvum]